MGRSIQSSQRNWNRSLRTRKMQNRSPRDETLERLQLKEILQITQNPNLNQVHRASSWEATGRNSSVKSIRTTNRLNPSKKLRRQLDTERSPNNQTNFCSITQKSRTTSITHPIGYVIRPYKVPPNRFLISLCSTPLKCLKKQAQ